MAEKIEPFHLVAEPIFGIYITFADGSKPMEWFNLSLKQAMEVLQEWSENWILIPEEDCKLNDTVWKWNAHVRPRIKPKERDDSETETYADILDPFYPTIEEETEPCE